MSNSKKIVTYFTGESADFAPGKLTGLFSCDLDLGPGHSEHFDYSVGLDDEGVVQMLWSKSDWSDDDVTALAWVPVGTYPEPKVWSRLLEAYLCACRDHEDWTGAEFTSLKVAKRSPITLAEIKAVIEKVWK